MLTPLHPKQCLNIPHPAARRFFLRQRGRGSPEGEEEQRVGTVGLSACQQHFKGDIYDVRMPALLIVYIGLPGPSFSGAFLAISVTCGIRRAASGIETSAYIDS